jgi:S1-C subfamily serine protease
MRTGLLVMGVEPGGPADQAGLMLGDILVSLAGQSVGDADELQAQLGGDRVGTAVPVTVFRGGQRRDLTVTIGERS